MIIIFVPASRIELPNPKERFYRAQDSPPVQYWQICGVREIRTPLLQDQYDNLLCRADLQSAAVITPNVCFLPTTSTLRLGV